VEAVGEAGLDNGTSLGERRKRFFLNFKGKKRKNCT
jgi:hypothetical protein